MSIAFRKVMKDGTARTIAMSLDKKVTSPDHEDLVLGLQAAMEIIAVLEDRVEKLEKPPKKEFIQK